MKEKNDLVLALDNLLDDEHVPIWAKVLVRAFENLTTKCEPLVKLTERVAQLEQDNRILKVQIAGFLDEINSIEDYYKHKYSSADSEIDNRINNGHKLRMMTNKFTKTKK